jgi:type I site-specific restriction-modification system R (restriction) subunit
LIRPSRRKSFLRLAFKRRINVYGNIVLQLVKSGSSLLISGEVRSQSRSNVVQGKAFTERLEASIARYHANALMTVQVLEELIQLAKEIRAARARGEETRL